MDKRTIDIYNQEAGKIALLHSCLVPERLYQLAHQFFITNGKTLDVGCGIGRDTAWLSNHGFPVTGLDASRGMLEQAINRYPGLNFIQENLPDLSCVNDMAFHNIFCSAVLMHLNYESLPIAVINLLRSLKNNGILIVSFRNTEAKNCRENGKLYEKINIEELVNWFKVNGGSLLYLESLPEIGRNYYWHNLVFKKSLCLVEPAPTYV